MDRQWPPNYVEVFAERQRRLKAVQKDRSLIIGAKAYYPDNPHGFIDDFGITYDPRNAATNGLALMPFILFQRQKELVDFILDCLENQEAGLIEKSRDMGATWICCAFSVWLWLFKPGISVGWGSRKETLVDKIGDPDSIFEKMRMFIDYLPRWLWPQGFNQKEHLSYMKIINPENGSTITGESGDNIGRGGRKAIYFKDEAQPLNAMVLTPDGWELMANIKAGMFVIGLDGKPCRVIRVKVCGEHYIYKIGFSDGSYVECSPNHLWTINKVWGKKKTLILRTQEIERTFIYKSPEGKIQYKYRIPNCNAVEFNSREDDLSLDPYIVGALLGDGSVSQVPFHCPKVTTADKEIVSYIERALPEGCVLNRGRKYEYRLVDKFSKGGVNYKSRARQAVVRAGIAGCKAETKFIPDRYKFASPENRLKLLQGLMDTDGSASGDVVSFHTCSKKLARDVIFIVQSLGGKATHNIKPDHRGYRDMHVLHIALPNGLIPFKLQRKIQKTTKRTHTIERTIISVAISRKDKVKCISVDRQDGLYLTDNFIATHNSAWYERPERIEASIGDNTNVPIDISSVHGTNTIFYRRRQAGEIWDKDKQVKPGITRVFILDWREHPLKTQEWYDRRRAKAEREGLLHTFAQEVDRDSSASVEGVLIPAKWVKAAIDAHIKLGFEATGLTFAGLDVADEGGDKNAVAVRKGSILKHISDWAEGDTTETANRAVGKTITFKVNELQYDCIGVGAGIKGETNRLKKAGDLPKGLIITPWNASDNPHNPDESIYGDNEDEEDDEYDDSRQITNKDFFVSLKAQAYWNIRTRFYKTYQAVIKGVEYDPDELISIPSDLENRYDLETELSQPTYSHSNGKVVVNKKPKGAKSPNMADAVVIAFFPVENEYVKPEIW